MAEFIKSSTEVILHQPSGGDWDVYSSTASIYLINLVMHIKGVDGAKELKLKKYHTKSQGETYFLLSTSPDVDSNNATDDAAILTQDLAEDEYRVCAYAQKVQKNDSISSEYSLIKPASSGYGGYRWQLKSRNADGRHTKVVFDAAKVPTLVSVKCGMWGQDTYGNSCTPFVIEVNGFTAQTSRFHTGNYVGEATLNVPLPLNMLVKRDDGLLYTLGGAGAGGGNFVTTDKEQLITGKKTFSKVPQVTAKPAAPNDVATVGYVSGLLNAKAPYEVTLDFKVEANTDGGWVVYSNMEINLDNGKKLKCIHLDNTQPTSANAPVKAVFKAIPATEVINAAPTAQAPTFFDTYQLQDEEYLGTLTYGHILNSQLQDYASYTGPFHTNQYGTTCTIAEATQLRITLSELPAAVSKVSLKFDSSYLPKTFKASLSGVGMDVTSNVLTNPSGNTPLELLFDVVKLTGLVTLDTAQTITGAKTFEKLPKSEATPVDDHELVNKAYVDSLHPKKETSLTIFGSFFDNNSDGGTWISYSDLKISLLNGAHLVPIYLENTAASRATEPVKVIFKVSNTPYVANSVQAQAKDWFDTYVLKEDECLGSISYARVLDIENVDSHNYANLSRPFDEMLVKRVKDLADMHGEYPMIKFTVEGLPAKFSTVNITIATPNYWTNPPYSLYVLATDGDNSYKSKVYNKDDDNFSADASNLTKLSIPIGLADPSLVTLHTQQELTALKTFKVLPQSEAVPADDKDLVNKKYVDEKVGAGGGTGGAAPANMVTTDTAQNITEVKTFDKLPKSSVEPTDDTELVNKKYVDSKAASAGGNVVTLDTEQSITAVKTFEKLPKSDAVPADANELVNKAYVDAAAKSLQGYEITLYGTPKATGLIGFKNLRFYFANGLRLYPRLVDDTAANTANEAKRFIWTLVNTSSYEDVQAQAKPKAELDKYVLTSSEYDGLITYPQTCGKFTLTRNNWFAIGGYVRVQGQASNGEQPIVKLRVLGSVAPITKMELTIDSDTNYIAESLRAEVSKIGDTPKASNTVNPTAVNELVTFNIEETFKPDAYYVNRFDDQDVFGRKAFKSVPKIDKAPVAYGLADANESTAFGDLYGSAAIAKPVSQSVNFDIGTTQERKAPSSGSVWQSKYTCKVQIYNFAPKIRRPDTYEEAQLYLKAVGPSSEGYRGILSLEKPSNYPQLSSIQVMDQDTMNGYKLQANEYFCKLQYLTGSGNKSRTEEALNNALKSGSDKIKQLFSSDASEWWTATSSWHRDHASANNPDDIPWAVVNLFIYNAPVLCAVPASNSSSYTSRRNDTLSVTSAAYYANVSTSLDLPAVNWAQKVRDVQMCSVDVLAAIRALQKTNTALEARIKALEDAAPKPQYKLIVVICNKDASQC